MMAMSSMPSSLRLAFAALALAGVFLGWSVLRAMNPMVVTASRIDTLPVVVAPEAPASQRTAQISAAVDVDPFSPTRTRPAVRYRLAHEMAEVAATPQRTQLRWAGVVLAADSTKSFLSAALGSGNNAPIEMLKVGDKLGEYTLMSFDLKSATFQNASGELLKIYNPIPGNR